MSSHLVTSSCPLDLTGTCSVGDVALFLVVDNQCGRSTGDVGGWRLMWVVVAMVTVVMGNDGQVSWLMVVWGRGKKFVFVLGYEGCLYLVTNTNCICIWLRTLVETSYTSLLSVFTRMFRISRVRTAADLPIHLSACKSGTWHCFITCHHHSRWH